MQIPKIIPFRDKKYHNSFKVEGEHFCLITDTIFPDFAHVRKGWLGQSKPHDYLVMPLKHELHMEQGKSEPKFWRKYFYRIPEHLRRQAYLIAGDFSIQDDLDLMNQIKLMAWIYYNQWLTATGLSPFPLPASDGGIKTLITKERE
jgi:hypothetical protein